MLEYFRAIQMRMIASLGWPEDLGLTKRRVRHPSFYGGL